jgi:hypothetical protein
MDGNVRVKVLEERGLNVDGLEREEVRLRRGYLMTVEEAITVFSSYSAEEKKEFVAQLMHDLTVVARDGYEVGAEGLTNPRRVRKINEIQHRLSSFLRSLLRDDPRRYPDELIVRMALEAPEDEEFARQLARAFESAHRAATAMSVG